MRKNSVIFKSGKVEGVFLSKVLIISTLSNKFTHNKVDKMKPILSVFFTFLCISTRHFPLFLVYIF